MNSCADNCAWGLSSHLLPQSIFRARTFRFIRMIFFIEFRPLADAIATSQILGDRDTFGWRRPRRSCRDQRANIIA
jgi:hypothetical protein